MFGGKKNKNREYFKGVLAKLIFVNKEDKNVVLNSMKWFSSAVRFAYNRLVEGIERSVLWKVNGPIGERFKLDSYYIQAVLLKAEALLESAKELGVDPRKVIFGGRKLFFEFQKKHNPKLYRRRKREWWEKRQGLLYCRGNTRSGGNPNLRLEVRDGALYLKIKVGNGEYVEALVKTSHPELENLLQRVYTKLEDKTFYQNAATFYQNPSSDLDAQIPKEKNPSTKRRLLREKSKAQRALDLLSSLSSQSSSAGPISTNARVRGKTRGRKLHGRDPWRVLRVGVFRPLLGLEVPRDFSPLKRILNGSLGLKSVPPLLPPTSPTVGPWRGSKGKISSSTPPRSSIPGLLLR